MTRLFLVLPLLLLVACETDDDSPRAPQEGELTSAQEVTDRMIQRYEANQGAVDTFSVRGGGGLARHTRNPDDSTGTQSFHLTVEPTSTTRKLDPETMQLLYVQVPNVPGLATGMRQAELGGVVTRDGRRAYVLSTDDPSGLLGGAAPPGDHELRLYVDAETFDILEIYRSVVDDTTKAPITDRILYSDFQETDGLVLPHTVRHVLTGVNRDMTEEVKVREMGNIALERARAEQMPAGPEKLAATEQAERQQRMIAEGIAEATLTVEEVRVGAEPEVPATNAPETEIAPDAGP